MSDQNGYLELYFLGQCVGNMLVWGIVVNLGYYGVCRLAHAISMRAKK